VIVWNDLYLDPATSDADKQRLRDAGGLAHYYALCDYYGYDVPSYFQFDVSFKDVYDDWANLFEPALIAIYGYEKLMEGLENYAYIVE